MTEFVKIHGRLRLNLEEQYDLIKTMIYEEVLFPSKYPKNNIPNGDLDDMVVDCIFDNRGLDVILAKCDFETSVEDDGRTVYFGMNGEREDKFVKSVESMFLKLDWHVDTDSYIQIEYPNHPMDDFSIIKDAPWDEKSMTRKMINR